MKTVTAEQNGEIIVAVFPERTGAESAVNELNAAGFSEQNTGMIVRGTKDPGDDDSPIENDSELQEENAAGGALAGGTIGGIIGAAATGMIPGVGPVIAAGALAGVLGGAAAGGVAGGVLGALKGIGVPEEEAKRYQAEFEAGHPVVTVQANGRRAEAWEILRKNGGSEARARTPDM